MKVIHRQAMIPVIGPNLPKLNGPGSKSLWLISRIRMGMPSAVPVYLSIYSTAVQS